MPELANEHTTVRLTSLSHGGGCGCKLAPAVLEQIIARSGAARLIPPATAGRDRDQRRRRGLPDQRGSGDCRHDRLLHADRRRSVRLWRHRRDQCHLGRLRHGRPPALRAGTGGDADRQAAARDDPANSRRRRIGLPARRHSRGRRPQRRFGGADLRPGGHRPRRSPPRQAQRGGASRATRSSSARRWASASTAPRSRSSR